MRRKILLAFYIVISCSVGAQSTDLSTIIEAEDLDGNVLSQVTIFEEFQYLVTVLNSGNEVSGSDFRIELNENVQVNSVITQNTTGGATPASNVLVNEMNVVTGIISNMPNNSSIEIIINLNAPTILGGIAANTLINSPDSITDTNLSNNVSIISIDVVDIEIDFEVSQVQINPAPNTTIDSWGDTITYQFTITNNSSIDYPLQGFSGNITRLSEFEYGAPIVRLESISCIDTTNGTVCPDLSNIDSNTTVIITSETVFSFEEPFIITSGGSSTFEVVYEYLEPSCGTQLSPLAVESLINISLNHSNASSNSSNVIETDLIEGVLCPITDVCIDTVQLSPDNNQDLNYGDLILFETTVCNNGPNDATVQFFLQNLSTQVLWENVNAECIATTGNVPCNSFNITENGQIWFSNNFLLPTNTTITIQTEIQYLEPLCTDTEEAFSNIRSTINITDALIVDSDYSNNTQLDLINLPAVGTCGSSSSSNVSITKMQISPELPLGESASNTIPWGNVGYEITVTNIGELDAVIEVIDYMPAVTESVGTGTLISIECVSATGTAGCFEINNANFGIPLDGISEGGQQDVFWEILPEENVVLPANSSITFRVFIDWLPNCSQNSISFTNNVTVDVVSGFIDNDINNNDSVTTFFSPCIDLIAQTYPESTQVNINQTFDWIVDISNSITSSNAVDVEIENTVNSVFEIVGNPVCTVISGNATCIVNFDITDNIVRGIIPDMEAGSTIQIRIPVMAPSYGGAFNNVVEAIVNGFNNQELTPETNLSISNVQVIAPELIKDFIPNEIIVGNETLLTFTVFNLSSNPVQNDISFLDNLPLGLSVSQPPFWQESNGCSGTFIGVEGSDEVGIINLSFPEGIDYCKFSVWLTSNIVGEYINNNENFTDINNIDTSQAFATLSVIDDPTNVDIAITKTVVEEEVSIGDFITFSIEAINIGSSTGTNIIIEDILPSGYEFISYEVTNGIFNQQTFSWSLNSLESNQSETLTITVRVISSTDLLNIARLIDVNETDRDSSNNQDSAEVSINNCLEIPEGFSPNGDNFNDYLIVPCIENYPNNVIKIFNRLGTQVFEKENYNNGWKGESNMGILNNSNLLPIGVYFYILEIESFNKPFIGYIYLNY